MPTIASRGDRARATELRPVVSEVQTFIGSAPRGRRSYGVDEVPEPRKPRRAVARPSAEPCASNAPVRFASTSGTTARATDSARPTRYASRRPAPGSLSPRSRISSGGRRRSPRRGPSDRPRASPTPPAERCPSCADLERTRRGRPHATRRLGLELRDAGASSLATAPSIVRAG